MNATTIKIEGALLRELNAAKPSTKSLSRYVREILEQELRRRKLVEAGRSYDAFLSKNPAEQKWLEEWVSADLANPPEEQSR